MLPENAAAKAQAAAKLEEVFATEEIGASRRPLAQCVRRRPHAQTRRTILQ